jgi:hypothetical protein
MREENRRKRKKRRKMLAGRSVNEGKLHSVDLAAVVAQT